MTLIPYPNLTARSANGRFRLEATGGLPNDGFRSQSRFTYRLFESNRLVWTRATGDQMNGLTVEDGPHEAWVNESGWSLIRTHSHSSGSLMVFTPTGDLVLSRQHRRLRDDDEPGLLDDEPEEYMSWTSAGPFWAHDALAYFHEHAGRPFWTMRTWWGRHITIHLENATILDATKYDQNEARASDICWALTLR